MNALTVLKSRTALFVAALAIGLSTTAAHAQTQKVAYFDAPFAFEYGSQHLPAGRYTARRENPRVMLILSRSNAALAVTQTSFNPDGTDQGKIVFHKVGHQYFLRQVWIPGEPSHLSCLPSKAERVAEKEARVALNDTAPSTVEVALLETPR